LYKLDAEPSAEDTVLLHSMMNAGTAAREEFMG
jgi:hypothetical protein